MPERATDGRVLEHEVPAALDRGDCSVPTEGAADQLQPQFGGAPERQGGQGLVLRPGAQPEDVAEEPGEHAGGGVGHVGIDALANKELHPIPAEYALYVLDVFPLVDVEGE